MVPLLCCAGPILLVALGGTGMGAIFAGTTGNWWLSGIFAALVIVMIVLILKKLLKGQKRYTCESNEKTKNKLDCCTPQEIMDRKNKAK